MLLRSLLVAYRVLSALTLPLLATSCLKTVELRFREPPEQLVLRIITGESAQVTTLAGSCDKGAVDGPGASARFNIPWLLSNDERGRLLVAELGNPNRVSVVTL